MQTSLVPVGEEMKAIQTMAQYANDSKFFNNLGGMPGIMTIMFRARELGVPLMEAVMGGMHNVMGKITLSPQLMNNMIRKAGHTMEIDSNDLRCIIKGRRKDTSEEAACSFSIEDAKKAGLYKAGGGWEKYPSDMCFARAMSRLARRLFPDVIGNSYVEGEIEIESSKRPEKKFQEAEEINVDTGEIIIADKPKDLISEDDLNSIIDLLEGQDELRANVLKAYSASSIADLPGSKSTSIIDRIKIKLGKKEEA